MNKEEVKIAHKILLDLLVQFDKFCRRHRLSYYIIGGTLLGSVRHKGFIPWDVDADVAMPREDYEKMLTLIATDFPCEYYIQNINTEPCFHTPKTKILVAGARKDNPNNYLVSARTGLNLDIFPLDTAPKGKTRKMIQRAQINFFKFLLACKMELSKKPKSRMGRLKSWLRNLARLALLPVKHKFIISKMTGIMIKYNHSDSPYLCSMSSKYDYNRQVMDKDIYGVGQEVDFEGYKLMAPDRTHEYLTQLYGDYMRLPSNEKREAMYRELELSLDEALVTKYSRG